MEQHPLDQKDDISRGTAFFAGVCDSLPGIVVPIPVMLPLLYVLKKFVFNVGMAGVNSFLPFAFGWWVVPLCGAVYAVFRIGHQRRVCWCTVSFGVVFGTMIPCWILVRQLAA